MEHVQQSPDTARPAVSAARARSARALAARAARYQLLRRLPMLPEPSRLRLHQRAGRRLTPTGEAIYAVIRKAVRCGYPGAHVSVGELGHLTGRSERSVRYALRDLEELDLVHAAPQFDNVEWIWCAEHGEDACPAGCARRRRYRRRQLASVYVLGCKAKRPGRPRANNGNAARSLPRLSDHGGKTCPPTAPPGSGGDVPVAPGARAPSTQVARAVGSVPVPETAQQDRNAPAAPLREDAPALPDGSAVERGGAEATAAPDPDHWPANPECRCPKCDTPLRRQIDRTNAAWLKTPAGRRDRGGQS